MTETKTRYFFKQTLLGGLIVLLPVGIMLAVGKWIFGLITDVIQPLTNLLIQTYDYPEFIGDFIAISLIIIFCFVIGWLVTTGAGRWFHHRFDTALIKMAPGYRIVREVVTQVLGSDEESPFSKGEVCLVRIYGAHIPVKVTGIITSRSEQYATVFVPTCPNPTSGFAYQVSWELIERRPDIGLDSAVRTIFSCGAGSAQLFGKELFEQDQV